MNKLIILVLFLLSPQLYAQTPSAFMTVGDAYKETNEPPLIVKNMPKVRSQDSFDICSAFAAWTMLQQHQCAMTNSSCQDIAPENTPSVLYFASLGEGEHNRTKQDEAPYLIPRKNGGSAFFSLYNALVIDWAYAESCFPVDQFVSKYGGNNKEMEAAIVRLEEEFAKSQSTPKTDVCFDCFKTILKNDFNYNVSDEILSDALTSEDFQHFWFGIFLLQCEELIQIKPYYEIISRPLPEETKGFGYEQFIAKTKEVIKTNRVMNSGVCVFEKVRMRDCKSPHEIVISGYKKVCKNKDTCRDLIHITNSWGKDWQDLNNDGWFDAKNFYEYVTITDYAFYWLKATKSNRPPY